MRCLIGSQCNLVGEEQLTVSEGTDADKSIDPFLSFVAQGFPSRGVECTVLLRTNRICPKCIWRLGRIKAFGNPVLPSGRKFDCTAPTLFLY